MVNNLETYELILEQKTTVTGKVDRSFTAYSAIDSPLLSKSNRTKLPGAHEPNIPKTRKRSNYHLIHYK